MENTATPPGFESCEGPQDRRTNFQTIPLPAIPNKKVESIEDENAYYSDENEFVTNRCVFQQRDLSFVLKLSSGSIYDRWIVTLSKQNKSSTYFVASTVTVGSAAQEQITHWNDFAKRILEIPDVEFVVNTRGICIDGECLYLIQDHIMCQTLEKYQSTKKETGQLPSVSEVEIMRFVMDILKGMEFIHSYGFLHPGISRRKILLTNQGQCKLYNFCLNEDATKVSSLLKVKGYCSLSELPLETLMRNEYSQGSDVWCTGVVIWEIFTEGSSPFLERNHDYVNFGNALMGPTSWPKQNRKIQNNHLFECWRKDVTMRPTISQLKDSFENIMTLANISIKDVDLSNDYMPMGGNET